MNNAYRVFGTMIALTVVALFASASEPPASFTFQGKILKANGTTPVEDAAVTFKVQLRSPDGLCLLFEETHLRNMTATTGVFSLAIGQGTNTNASPLSLLQVFDNSVAKTGAAGCSYTPQPGDFRRLRLSYDNGVDNVTLAMDQNILSVPYAMYSQTLGGLDKTGFLQVSSSSTQAKADAVLAKSTEILNLVSGAGTTVPDAPTSGTSAVNKNYVDSKFGGSSLDLTGVTNGQTISWNQAQSKWESHALTNGTVTQVIAGAGLAGGTITSSGTLSLAVTGVTAGVYSKVTVDTYGRVTAGATLSESDFPSLTSPGKVSGNAITSGSIGGSTAVNTSGNITTTATVTASSVSATSASLQSLRMFDSTNNKKISLAAPSSLAADVSFTLPSSTGTAGQVLTTDGSGNLSWLSTSSTSIAWSQITSGKPTTLAGYGITDAIVADGSGLVAVNKGGTGISTTPASGQMLIGTGTGTGWTAAYANASQLRGVGGAAQFPQNCLASQTLTYQSATDTYICSSIAIASSQVSGLGAAATVGIGTTAGTVAAGNDSRITGALQSTTSVSGDLSGTYGATTVSKIQGVAVSTTAPTAGQIMLYNATGTKWQAITPAAGTGVTVTANSSGLTIAADVGTTANKVVQLDSNAKLPAVDGSQLTNLPIPFNNMQVFDSSGTFNVPANVTKVFVQAWGGGGGGGAATSVLGVVTGGSGGGGGAYTAGFVTVTAGGTVSVTIGAAGTRGTTGGNGGNGGNTSFSSITANGGTGGAGGSLASTVGGTASAGLSVAGGRGYPSSLGNGGSGGDGAGGGGQGGPGSSVASAVASDGGAPGGAGGGGAGSGLVTSNGGDGSKGRIVVWY